VDTEWADSSVKAVLQNLNQISDQKCNAACNNASRHHNYLLFWE
jgi:hypothetical protein